MPHCHGRAVDLGASYRGPSTVPGDDVIVKIAKKTFGNAYRLKISDANATVVNAASSWNLQVTVGNQVSTQSVALRSTRNGWMLP